MKSLNSRRHKVGINFSPAKYAFAVFCKSVCKLHQILSNYAFFRPKNACGPTILVNVELKFANFSIKKFDLFIILEYLPKSG